VRATGAYTDAARDRLALIATLAAGTWTNVFSFHAPRYASAATAGKIVGIAADGPGYLLATSNGKVTSVNAPSFGSVSGAIRAPVVGIATDQATGGYWLATSAGHIYSFHAPSYGSLTGKTLPAPVVAVAADGLGYLLITRAGHVYSFHMVSYGSVAGKKPPAPIAGIAVAG
jgi:hypothetical protein